MAVDRSQYISEAELREITGKTTDDYPDGDATKLKIYESSELMKAHCYRWSKISEDDYTVSTAPTDLKLATAYQVLYNDENPGIDSEYEGGSKSISVGKTSETSNYGGVGSQEYRKIAPKAQRYLIQSDLITRIL